MEVTPRSVSAYLIGEDSPFDDWMDGLRDLDGRVQIEKRINKLRRGLLGEYRGVGDGLIELKIDVGPGYRVYCADDGANVLLLCGGKKGSQDVDIDKAKQYWKDYKARGQ